jgi:signal transduction histidine kinase
MPGSGHRNPLSLAVNNARQPATAFPTRDAADEAAFADRTFRSLIDAAQEGVVVLAPDRTVAFCNRAFAAMRGAERRSIHGTRIEDHLAGVGGVSWPILLAAPETELRTEMTLVRGDGTSSPVDVVVFHLDLDDKAHCALFVTDPAPAKRPDRASRERTDRPGAAPAERGRTEESLRQAQRLQSVGHLTGGIAHDFNNLLTVIGGSAELLTSEKLDQEVRRTLAQAIQSAAERGVELTQRLLSLARREVLRPVTTDVNRLVRGMGALLRQSTGKAIELRLALHDALWPAFADPGQVEMAVLNLAVNARDAMPDGGCLTISTANVVVDDAHLILSEDLRPGPYVMITVADTGVGMPPDLVARAFEPFFTTKGAGKGSGLGLAMVYGFVKQSGGHVAIDSAPGEGTRVRLYLPRSDEADIAPEADPVPLPFARARPGERILLVEDDPMVRSHAQMLLRSLGYEVVTAADGPAALALIDSGLDCDLLFTDVVMPGGKSGRDLVAAARRRRRGLRVLYTSAYPLDAIVTQGRIDGTDDLLAKPYGNAALANKVREVLDRP